MSQMQQASPFQWHIHRGAFGKPKWWQRWYEAWLVVTGRYTFWHAYDHGKHQGQIEEYRRIVVNGGDLVPVLDAAIYAICAKTMNGAEPIAALMNEYRRAIWERYERDRSAVVSALGARVNHGPANQYRQV